jgi:hypothetical protein
MALSDLLPELHKLSRPDKLRAMRFLVYELAVDEDILLTQTQDFEIWSPYDAAEAADDLYALLKADEQSRDA